METKILSALIAGGVSLGVSLATFWATRSKIESEKERQERELERKLTEKLYDLRIRYYPQAFKIMQALMGKYVLSENFSPERSKEIRDELENWHNSDVSFILSDRSEKAYWKLRDALSIHPEEGNGFSGAQKKVIHKVKSRFRGELKKDLHLLFKEDEVRVIRDGY